MPVVHLRLTIHGQVQGVGFRFSARKEAERLGLRGFVRNEEDGSVTIEAEGEAEALDKYKAWCRHGPRFARVVRVDCAEGPVRGYESFEIAY